MPNNNKQNKNKGKQNKGPSFSVGSKFAFKHIPSKAFKQELITKAAHRLIDIGANLTNPRYHADVSTVIQRAKDAGIIKIMITGTSEKASAEALTMAGNDGEGFLVGTAGVHPHDAKHYAGDQSRERLIELSKHPKCVAIGECGLDFNRNFSPPDVQLHVFEEQVKLACELKKPLFIHEREASEQMVNILTKYKSDLPPAVIHCFTGTTDEVTKYIEMGLYVGLTGFLWKDKLPNGVQAALRARHIPLNQLMVETDAPFMYPNIKAKKFPSEIREKISEHSMQYLSHCSFDRNEPCSLSATVDMIAGFMDVPSDQVAQATTQNAIDVFGLD